MSTVSGYTTDYIDGLQSALESDIAGKANAVHGSTHGSAGSDPIVLAQSQVTGLVSDLGTKAEKDALVINVVDYGATGNGSTDDAASIQAAINASPAGGIIFFPPGTYVVGTTIKLLKSRTYKGSGRELTKIQMKASSNLNAVLASETWLSTTSTNSDNPINICDLGVDANYSNQTSGAGHGIALITFWNTLENLEVKNCRGMGILLTTKRLDGTEVSNTAVENKIIRCAVRETCKSIGTAGSAIVVEDATSSTQSVTDGWIVDCIVQNTNGSGIYIATPAGWLVQGNHIYGAQCSGIYFDRGGHVRILDNYIETWGNTATVGIYGGIQCGGDGFAFVGSSSPIVIMGNTMFYTSGAAAGSSIRGIVLTMSNGITGHIVIVGNGVAGATQATGSNGIRITNQGSTCTAYVYLSANTVYGWDTSYAYSANGGAIYPKGDAFFTGLATGTTDGFGRMPTCAGTPTGTPADLTNGVPFIYDTTNNKLYIYNGSWQASPSLASPTFTGTATFSGREVSTPDTVTISSAHAAIDASLGNIFDIAANANFTLDNPTNPVDGQKIQVRITQDATGNRTITLGSAWNTGPVTVTLSTAANKRDHLIAMYNAASSKWDILGFQAGY